MNSLIIIEHKNGRIHRMSKEAIAGAQKLGSKITALVIGRDCEDVAKELLNFEMEKTITVNPLNNKPDSFTGAVGVFNISSSLSSTDVENGTPVTFYIKLKGEGNLDNIGRPRIDFPKNLDVFEGEITKERDISDKVSGSLIWEYNLIPRKSGK